MYRKRGDPMELLISPNRRLTITKPLGLSSAQPNVQASISLDVYGIDVTGRWRLRIFDMALGNTGYLGRCSMTFKLSGAYSPARASGCQIPLPG